MFLEEGMALVDGVALVDAVALVDGVTLFDGVTDVEVSDCAGFERRTFIPDTIERAVLGRAGSSLGGPVFLMKSASS